MEEIALHELYLYKETTKRFFPGKEFAMSATNKKISEIKHAFSAEELKGFL